MPDPPARCPGPRWTRISPWTGRYRFSGRKRVISMDASERQAPRLFDEVRRRMRLHHYSLRTERAYLGWIRRFILANGRRHPRTMGAVEVERFLTTLAVEGGVAASTQNQALSALLFLYREVLGSAAVDGRGRPRQAAARVPTVLSRRKWRAMAGMDGRRRGGAPAVRHRDAADGGLRLRVKDVDFIRNEIVVRDGKGGRDRRTVLPATLAGPLQAELERARVLHRGDLEDGFGAVWLRMRWRASIRPPRASSAGSTCSRPAPLEGSARRRRAPPPPGRRGGRARSAGAARGRHRQAGLGAHAAPPLRHPPARGRLRQSAPSRNCSDTRTSPPRRSTPTCSTAAAAAWQSARPRAGAGRAGRR